jgi:hypothetical protein
MATQTTLSTDQLHALVGKWRKDAEKYNHYATNALAETSCLSHARLSAIAWAFGDCANRLEAFLPSSTDIEEDPPPPEREAPSAP